MNEQHCAAASHAQYWADRCFTAETANAAGTRTATTAIIPVPATANEPSREDTRSQPRANAKSNSSPTYAQALMKIDLSLSPVVKRTARTQPNAKDSPANAARASAAADPETSVTELRHNPVAENPAAAALRTAANAAAAAAAECDDPRILQTVLLAAAATANALAHTGAQGTVQAHRRGGRPPRTRRARPRRNRRQNPGR